MKQNLTKDALLHDIESVHNMLRKLKLNDEFCNQNHVYCYVINETLLHLQTTLKKCDKPII